jgi:hypothetical protein
MYLFLGEKTKVGGGHLVQVLKPLEVTRSMKIDKALKLMARRGSRVAFHHKGLEPKNVPRQRGQKIWAIIPTQKISRGTTFNKGGTQRGKPPNVGNEDSGIIPPRQIMLVPWTECLKVALCYQGKL